MAALAVFLRAADDEEELFRLYQDVFGHDLTEGSRRRWRWQYLENPATPPSGPQIWVARDDDALLGQYASMPVCLWWGGREVSASWGMDVFVSEKARGRGVGAQLFTNWSDHVEVALGLGLTPSSYGLFKKLRYDDVGPVPFFQKVLDPGAVAGRRLGPVLGALAGPVLGAALSLRHPTRGLDAPGVSVGTAGEFGPEFDVLWERARASYRMCVRRDARYLDWKYGRCPHKRYDIRVARRGGQLVGFAVSRHEDYRGLRLGWIIDVFADTADHAAKDALIAAVLSDFAEKGVARAQAFSLNAALAKDLERRGFRTAPSPMQFCVRSRVGGEDVLRDRGGWHVVFGDSDMDR
jgi:GNAT superfamily N-acetyltransferase